METVTLDGVDRALLHALMIDGRASFARLARVLDTSDRTVARRYARLRDGGVARVVGAASIDAVTDRWLIHVRCQPRAALDVASALARRDDTSWVDLLSGGTEISAGMHARTDRDRDELLLQRLPHTTAVVSITAHSVLHVYAGGPDGFRGLHTLDPDQVADLTVAPARSGPSEAAPALAESDRPLLRALARDGRASWAALAVATGWSESTVARRLETLCAAGLVFFDLDLDLTRLGFRCDARIRASVDPSRLAQVGAAVAAHPEVTFAAATTGPANLVLSVRCRDNADLYRYLTERLGALTVLRDVEIAPVIRTLKRVSPLPP